MQISAENVVFTLWSQHNVESRRLALHNYMWNQLPVPAPYCRGEAYKANTRLPSPSLNKSLCWCVLKKHEAKRRCVTGTHACVLLLSKFQPEASLNAFCGPWMQPKHALKTAARIYFKDRNKNQRTVPSHCDEYLGPVLILRLHLAFARNLQSNMKGYSGACRATNGIDAHFCLQTLRKI